MTPERLRQFGQMLFGERWQVELAQVLSVNDRTIRRWLSGKTSIPEGVELDLKLLLVDRRASIEKVLLGGYWRNGSRDSLPRL